MKRDAEAVVPGVALLLGIGLVAWATAGVVGVDRLIAAIVVGMLVANTVGVPERFGPGVRTRKLWLEGGIVLMGSRISVPAIVETGPYLLGLVVTTVFFTVALCEVVARHIVGTEEKLGSLLAAGSSVCGVSAVIAVAGSIEANEDQIAYAVATILLFDTLTVFLYPIVGDLLGLPARVYGVWTGLSMFSTGPVVAAGFARSEVAGQWATVTKVTRNLFIAVVAVGYSMVYARRTTTQDGSTLRDLWEKFPNFLLGFLAIVVVANAGFLSEGQTATLQTVYDWLFLLAFGGLGLSITAEDLRGSGIRPVVVVGGTLLAVSSVSLVVVGTLLSGT